MECPNTETYKLPAPLCQEKKCRDIIDAHSLEKSLRAHGSVSGDPSYHVRRNDERVVFWLGAVGADVAEAFGDEGVDGCFGEGEAAVVVELMRLVVVMVWVKGLGGGGGGWDWWGRGKSTGMMIH